MYNKRSLSKDTKASKAPKKISKPRDIIVDPMGQWKHPGKNTRIPSSDITMKGVPYPVLGVGSNGQEQMMYPGQEYTFPGAEYVDEYPQMKKGGGLKSKKFSRDLEATAYVFHESPLFKKPKSKKKKIFHPKAKHYQEGGMTTQEEIDAANNAMMKARLAYANMHGNTAAQRMVVAPDEPYQYTGNEYDQLWGQPVGAEPGMIGTHYMGSFGNYAVPFIQQGSNGLYFNEVPSVQDSEAIRFDNEDDAQYFGEHYKDIAPDASYREEYQEGGTNYIDLELTPEEIQQYRDGGYVVEDLEEMQKGGSRKTIYVDDPRDPRLKVYNDSLDLYNSTALWEKALHQKGRKDISALSKIQGMNMGWGPYAFDKDVYKNIKPESVYTYNRQGQPWRVHKYKKPVQKVKVTNKVKDKVDKKPKHKVVDEVPEVPVTTIPQLALRPIQTINPNLPSEIIQAPVRTVPNNNIVPPASKEIWKTLPDGTKYRVERPVDPRLTDPVKIGFYKKGGMSKAQRGIIVHDRTDPRLLAYNDSLQIFNNMNRSLNSIAGGAYPEDVYSAFTKTFKEDNSTGNEDYIGPRSGIRMEPTDWAGGDMSFPMFDKPKRPVIYQEPIPQLPIRELKTTTYPSEIIPLPDYTAYPREAGEIVPPKSKEIWVKGVDGQPYRIERAQDPRLTKPVEIGFYEKGGSLLTKKVTCKKCGWTWDAADGGNDLTTCHKCGSKGLVHAQTGGSSSQLYIHPDRKDAVYKKDSKGKWLIKSDDTSGKFVPLKDPDGKRAANLNKYAVPAKAGSNTSNTDGQHRVGAKPYTYAYPWKDTPDTPAEDLGEVFDPTGLSSWDDIARSYDREGLSGNTALEVFGAIPFLGKLKWAGKTAQNLGKSLANTARQKKSAQKFSSVLRGIGNYGPGVGRATDAYQAYTNQFANNNLGPKYQKGGITMGQEIDLSPEQEAHLRRLGYKLERIK